MVSKEATASTAAITFALGVATGWLLNRYARDSIDKAYKKFKAAL